MRAPAIDGPLRCDATMDLRPAHESPAIPHRPYPLRRQGRHVQRGRDRLRREHYPVLLREVTAERVKRHFGDLVKGDVERFELPNLGALNFLLHQALGGGGTVSLRTDAQGKTFGASLLGMEIEL